MFRSEPSIPPAPVPDDDNVNHQKVIYDREDRSIISDAERVKRRIVRALQFFEVFFRSDSPASDASSSPIRIATGRGILLRLCRAAAVMITR